MHLNRRESIEASRSHPPSIRTTIKEKASHHITPSIGALTLILRRERTKEPEPRRKTHDAFTPETKAATLELVGASTPGSLAGRKAKEAFTNPRKTSCQERSSSRDKTLTQIHQHVGENHRSEPTARRNERNEKEESHRRRHALRRAAGRRSYLIRDSLCSLSSP
ncbi:unnamed protein product [Brassica napus]|uniref:(rape) hypothetical protein n=1 Tax=Brassica napus TaxID=3708 RepID=A0A817AHJ7_BRANA|nr:unnamed protein product [Brassica napus]